MGYPYPVRRGDKHQVVEPKQRELTHQLVPGHTIDFINYRKKVDVLASQIVDNFLIDRSNSFSAIKKQNHQIRLFNCYEGLLKQNIRQLVIAKNSACID